EALRRARAGLRAGPGLRLAVARAGGASHPGGRRAPPHPGRRPADGGPVPGCARAVRRVPQGVSGRPRDGPRSRRPGSRGAAPDRPDRERAAAEGAGGAAIRPQRAAGRDRPAPRRPGAAAPHRPPPGPGDAAVSDAAPPARSVLIVDDDTNLLGFLAFYFEDKGFTVHTASDGAE